ncbi:uncharacterized protein DUF1465 [Rhodothalassium salexigens DSM 2132]|uniref:Uncharacterized protein DUF1465 n=1 Tax=Rhodothalassium salexigens DSM 2132 TaxID=1188247 RepID=A0A4R2PRT5_RHOSA|nr:DUF1465 family protein [Rhodothalassium salexigens]MBB4210293.1 regulator of CtrA degradation [Rhodothalassium salexigens DSM 2132]MBK1639202.1 hypothetical protein [Rhodothalassium salexigens DSM 2132]TCP38457.1 uncharacterized protein DUF1465 [Rhodothalassium salexigens DSM 2132]
MPVENARHLFLMKTYRDAVGLAERTYGCLSLSRNQAAANLLSRTDRLLYTAELMRLSTRIMYAVAWLMTRRAVLDGELTPEQAAEPDHRLGRMTVNDNAAAARIDPDLVPPGVGALMDEAERLYARVQRLEAELIAGDPLALDGAEVGAPSTAGPQERRPWVH